MFSSGTENTAGCPVGFVLSVKRDIRPMFLFSINLFVISFATSL
jgi:hypothetical protein